MTHPAAVSLRISLSASGGLQVELPWGDDHSRAIALAAGAEAETLKRILTARATAHFAIGLDGAPTEAQVRHWQRHAIWPDSRCAHCRAEGRGASDGTSRKRRAVVLAEHGGVTVRRLPAKSRKLDGSQRSDVTADEMGL